MIGAVHQLVPTFAARDAIGTHIRHGRDVLREMGLASEVFAGGFNGVARRDGHPIRAYDKVTRSGPPAALLYHLSTGSELTDFLHARTEPVGVDYHNITPPSFFAPWEPHVGVELAAGWNQLAELASKAAFSFADSAFNERDLAGAGYRDRHVVPVMVDVEALDRAVDKAAMAELEHAKRRGGADLLFVGRLSPNKCQHDLIKAFALYRKLYDRKARLHLVGGPSSHAYETALKRYAGALGLHHAVRLAGSVPDGVLAAHFRIADAFVCVSEHEGFCVPLLEAMWNRVPIVAYAATAVPETVGPAALLLHTKDPAHVAAAVHRVLSDGSLRDHLTATGVEQLGRFRLPVTKAAFASAVRDVLSRLDGP